MTWLFALFLLSSTSTEQAAARAEADAFAAVDAQRWCDAVHLFEAAHALAPAPALLDNAAQAAQLADDRVVARRLLKAALDVAAPADKKPLRARLASLKPGVGTACPAYVAPPEPPPPPPVVVEPPAPTPTPAPPPLPIADTVDVVAGPPLAPIVTTAIGGTLVIGGAIAGAVGLQPWLAHADAVKRLEQAEATKTVDEPALRDQGAARAAWESTGQVVTAVGAAAIVVGIVTAVGGLIWLTQAE